MSLLRDTQSAELIKRLQQVLKGNKEASHLFDLLLHRLRAIDTVLSAWDTRWAEQAQLKIAAGNHAAASLAAMMLYDVDRRDSLLTQIQMTATEDEAADRIAAALEAGRDVIEG